MGSSIDFVAALEKHVQETQTSPLWKVLQEVEQIDTSSDKISKNAENHLLDALLYAKQSLGKTLYGENEMTHNEKEKARLFDGGQWKWQTDTDYVYRMRGHTGEIHARAYSWNREAVYFTDGSLTWYMPNKVIEIKLSDGSWYYPWGEPKQDVPETVRPPSCQHKWVDVGVMHPKWVCFYCDKEQMEDDK